MSKNTKNFNDMVNFGMRCELAVLFYCAGRDWDVVDVREDEEHRKKDVDYLISKDGEHYVSMEVKGDTRIATTGNLFFEFSHVRDMGIYDGWFNYCEAEYICFLDATNDIAYICEFAKVKDKIMDAAKMITFYNKGDKCYTSGLILSINKAKQLGLIKGIWREVR